MIQIPLLGDTRMGCRFVIVMSLALVGASLTAPLVHAREVATAQPAENPLLGEWKTPYGVPPFGEIRPEHFLPAFRAAIDRHDAEIAAIAGNPARPTFDNTVRAFEESRLLLDRIEQVFSNLTAAATNEALQAVDREVSPLLAAHDDDVHLNEKLIARMKAVWETRAGAGLTAEDARLLERTWIRFVRQGALLDATAQLQLRKLSTELASLSVQFGERLLAENNAYKLVLTDRADLAGLPDPVIEAAAHKARELGHDGRWAFTLHAPSVWPFLQYSAKRELRRQIFEAYWMRGDHGDASDTKAILSQLASLRVQRANLLGFQTWADYILDDHMAKTPAGVYRLLNQLWAPSLAQAEREAARLRECIKEEGQDHPLEPWDWFYYAEKVRQRDYAFDENELRAYFELNRVRAGAFEVAKRLYGLTFRKVDNVPVYDPAVEAFEVLDKDGSFVALFLTDFHPRPGKQSGAWSSEFREQYRLNGQDVRPLVINVCNFTRPTAAAPALLSIDEMETLFHEFGHGLHSMLSNIQYRSLSRVPRDFVELPSQIMENWAIEPEVLRMFARHYQTGEVIPEALIAKLRKARRFNQGFQNVEYLAACYLDMDWHTLAVREPQPALVLERLSMSRIGMPATIIPRYRSTYFRHIWDGAFSYSAGYYSYVWAEVLDADAFAAFKEKGLFDPATAKAFRTLLEKGGTEEAMDLYRAFRGRDPAVEPLLGKRGLLPILE